MKDKNKHILTILLTIFSVTSLFGQDTIWVKEENKKYMYQGDREWLFKDNLPDGHYCSYFFKKKGDICVEVTFKNRKKEGIENRYFSKSKKKYAIVNWKNGMKNGLETHYNGNGTISHFLTFKDNILDGAFEINWSEGQPNYKGFYKNGYRDSIWTYYETGRSSDTSDYWLLKQIQYKNGRPYLISAWDKQGLQTVTNGNGTFDGANYQNGLKNGEQKNVDIKIDRGNEQIYLYVASEQIYKDGLLIRETEYFDDETVASISEWNYPSPVKIDTTKRNIDTYIYDIFYNAISYKYIPVRNGHWLACYPNRTKIFEGNYINGKRIGIWQWNYENGKQRIVADFSKNIWQHYDTIENIVSNLNNEFLTSLTDGCWFLNQKLDARSVTFTKRNTKMITPRFVFHYDGQLEINSFLECGKDIDKSLNSYNLLADTLEIIVPEEKTRKTNIYKFKIISVTDEKIKMQRIK